MEIPGYSTVPYDLLSVSIRDQDATSSGGCQEAIWTADGDSLCWRERRDRNRYSGRCRIVGRATYG